MEKLEKIEKIVSFNPSGNILMVKKEVKELPFLEHRSGDQTNVKRVAEILGEFTLNPGETFSFDESVGPRTRERGFKEGAAIIYGKLKPDLGGGICHPAGQIYKVALVLGLEILERNPHSRISYEDEGLDSMIWDGRSDLKFRNPYGYPVTFKLEYSDDNYLVVIASVPKNESIKPAEFEIIISDFVEFETEIHETEDYTPGTPIIYGVEGATVSVSRIDSESKTLISRDTYKPRNKVLAAPLAPLND